MAKSKKTILSPKTHSKILWHFTGGPVWDNAKSIQGRNSKPPDLAYNALLSILKSKELRVGSYHEIIKIFVAQERYYDLTTKKIKIRKNQEKQLKTSPVCCVADIPISELHYHCRRYGKIGIGFHRDALVRHGFNPVLYTPYNSKIIDQFYQTQRTLNYVDESGIVDEANSLKDQIENEIQDINEDADIDIDTSGIESAAEELKSEVDNALESFEDSLAIIKTYHPKHFEEIYAEREWRSTNTFNFKMEDVASILLPSSSVRDYFSEFATKDSTRLKIPRSVSILRWGDNF